MSVLISDVTATLQKVIMPYVRDNFDKKTILLDQMRKNGNAMFMNDRFYAPVRTQRSGGVTNLANDGASVNPHGDTTGQANVGVKIMSGAFNISKLTIDATRTTKGAVENELIRQADSLMNDFAKSANRQYYSDGFGVVAQVSTQGTTSVAVVAPNASLDDTRPQDLYGTVNNDISAIKYINPGQILAVGSGAVALGTVSSVSSDVTGALGTITFTGATVGSANQAVYIVDGDGTGAGTSEIQGVRLALSSGTADYAGISRSTKGWRPQIGTAQQTLALANITQKYVAALEYAQVGDRYAIFMNSSLYQKYGNLLTALRRSVNETELLGGWTGLEFAAGAGKVGVFLDFDVPDGEVEILNLDTWEILQVSEMDWLEDPNGGGLLRLAGKIQYQAVMAWFTNVICLAPGANGRLTQQKG